MSKEREQRRVEEKVIKTQARGVMWVRRKALIGEGDEWIPRSFIAEGPFLVKAKRYTLREPVYAIKATGKRLSKQYEIEVSSVKDMEEETWLGVVGRAKKGLQQWYATLRGQPNAETLNVTFSPDRGNLTRVGRRRKKRRIRAFVEKFSELPVEEQTDFLKDFVEKVGSE